jgi:hypothetical protein
MGLLSGSSKLDLFPARANFHFVTEMGPAFLNASILSRKIHYSSHGAIPARATRDIPDLISGLDRATPEKAPTTRLK